MPVQLCVYVKRILGRGADPATYSMSPGAGASNSTIDRSCRKMKVLQRLYFHLLASLCRGHVSAVIHARFPRCSCCRSVCTMCLLQGPKRRRVPDPLLGWIRGTSDTAGGLSWGSAEMREREVAAMLTRRRQCQTGSGRCLALQTGTRYVQMPETVVTPAVASHEAGWLQRAVFFIRPLPLSQAACAFPDMLKHSISRSPC